MTGPAETVGTRGRTAGYARILACVYCMAMDADRSSFYAIE